MPNLPLPLHLARSGATVVEKVLDWYVEAGRDFPWRLPRDRRAVAGEMPLHDPYMILVCEVMLQQTGTARVVEKLPQFLERFPTTAALASAESAEVIRAWKGMGYNRRVLNLQRAAAEIESRFGGVIPASVELLASLPGVGRYTASAVCCFAFGQAVPVVDVNIVRLLGRIFQKCHSDRTRIPEPLVWRIDAAILPGDDAYRWHQGLMDLGATICLPARPDCARCPVREECLSAFPSPLPLHVGARTPKSEPAIAGVPRRIWRGRVVELLRHEPQGVRLKDLVDRLLSESAGSIDRDLLRIAVDALRRDGLLRAHGVVHEGELGENDVVGL